MDRPADAEQTRPRIGVFGGSFDPPHVGHVSAACDVADILGLEEVVWVPARRSPHKDEAPGADAAARLDMVRAAIREDARFRVSDVELERGDPSFTVDTLESLRSERPDADLYLIVGIDQFRAFDAWHRPARLRELATIVVMDREGLGATADAGAVPVRVTRVDVSSTEVRRRVRAGEDVRDAVPVAVAGIIEARGLYHR